MLPPLLAPEPFPAPPAPPVLVPLPEPLGCPLTLAPLPQLVTALAMRVVRPKRV